MSALAEAPTARRRLSAARMAGLRGRGLVAVSLTLVGFVVLVVLVGVFWTPHDPNAVDVLQRFKGLSWAHPLGTDELGRDVLSRVMVGGRTSLLIALGATASGLLVGGVVAVVVGYFGGWIDLIVTRVIDIMLAIPALLIALGIVAITGPGAVSVSAALAVAYTPTCARVIRAAVVGMRHAPFVEASRGLGAGGLLVIWKDILPNAAPMITVQATSVLAWAILDEANLGFLGLGVQPPSPSWGSLLIEGRIYLFQAKWLPISAGAAVLIAVLGVNLLGDALRDVFDPRTSRRGR